MERGDISDGGARAARPSPDAAGQPRHVNHFTGVPVVLPITGGGGFGRMAGFLVSLVDAGTDNRGGALRTATRSA